MPGAPGPSFIWGWSAPCAVRRDASAARGLIQDVGAGEGEQEEREETTSHDRRSVIRLNKISPRRRTFPEQFPIGNRSGSACARLWLQRSLWLSPICLHCTRQRVNWVRINFEDNVFLHIDDRPFRIRSLGHIRPSSPKTSTWTFRSNRLNTAAVKGRSRKVALPGKEFSGEFNSA